LYDKKQNENQKAFEAQNKISTEGFSNKQSAGVIDYFLAVGFGSSAGVFAVAVAAAGSVPTVKPCLVNDSKRFAPIPDTRAARSFPSLNVPLLARSSMIFLDIAGPMPLMVSNSACVAVLTLMEAKAALMDNINANKPNKIFFNMESSEK
jgi:hypothetical protein